MKKHRKYDDIADSVFAPLYPIIADAAIQRTGKTNGRMLDIGCGGGHFGYAVMEKALFEGWFIDISPAAIDICKNRALDIGISERSHHIVGDVHSLPCRDDFFDLIVSRGSVGFWHDYPVAFKEIYRVLVPGGRTYIGNGLGNRETLESINEQMKRIDPEWPANIKKNQRQLSTDEFCGIFSNIGFEYSVISNDEEGRWFILSKPVN